MPELIGYLLTINAIVSWGLASLVYKVGLEKTDPKATILFRLVIVSMATFIFALIFGNLFLFSELSTNEIVFYLVLCLASGLSVTVGDICYFTALQKIDASRAYPLTQLSLIFVYPFAFIFFGEQISLSIIIGGSLILLSVYFLSTKDKTVESSQEDPESEEKEEEILLGVSLAIGTAFCWAVAIVAFHQARIVSNDVFTTNFVRIFLATITMAIVGIFQREYYGGFKKENRDDLKYYVYIGVAGSVALGFADSLFYKAAEINGLVLTTTITANTPMVQQLFSVLILKEKFRKRFLIAVFLIILGNYIILFL